MAMWLNCGQSYVENSKNYFSNTQVQFHVQLLIEQIPK